MRCFSTSGLLKQNQQGPLGWGGGRVLGRLLAGGKEGSEKYIDINNDPKMCIVHLPNCLISLSCSLCCCFLVASISLASKK